MLLYPSSIRSGSETTCKVGPESKMTSQVGSGFVSGSGSENNSLGSATLPNTNYVICKLTLQDSALYLGTHYAERSGDYPGSPTDSWFNGRRTQGYLSGL